MNIRVSSVLALAGIVAGLLVYTACGDDDAVTEPTGSSTSSSSSSSSSGGNGFDAGLQPDGAPKDCFDNPTTHFEIINACTTADRVERNPVLPLLLPDGGTPPL